MSKQVKTMQEKMILNKCFFGKSNCLKIMLNTNKECYMHWGIEKDKIWQWLRAKFHDEELGKIIRVLDGKLPSIAFFHSYNENKAQFWINRKENVVLLRAKTLTLDMAKSLDDGSQEVLSTLLKIIIGRMNLN
jgi:hypothetical protein